MAVPEITGSNGEPAGPCPGGGRPVPGNARAGGRRLLIGAAVLLLSTGTVGALRGEHPPLVQGVEVDCGACHGDLLEGRVSVHAAADDCTLCHDVAVTGEGTDVSLMEAEPSLCLLCHEELTAAVEGDLETPHFPVEDSCLNCHDPHASPEPKLLSQPTSELCAECHDGSDLESAHQGLLPTGSDCAACHDPHGSPQPVMLTSGIEHAPFASRSCTACHRPSSGERIRLRARGERLCTACHGDPTEEALAGGSVHAALAGPGSRAGCLGCHDPHLSDQPSLLPARGPALCEGCHPALVGGVLGDGGHFPAADDCLTCHRPHASQHRRLLQDSPDALCALCHDLEDEELTAAHLGADPATLACTACHDPHASEHPSLLAKTLHPPVLDGCDTCHEGSSDSLFEDGDSALCLLCHDDVGAAAEEAEFPHLALELSVCADCHNPHASAQEHLVKEPAGATCGQCHDEQLAGEGEVTHGIVEIVGCRACHEPHGGTRPKLLRQSPPELCLACHSPDAMAPADADGIVRLLGRFEVGPDVARAAASLRLSADGQRNHPVAGHRVLGTPTEAELRVTETTFEGELTCLTCHDPHKGRSRHLLSWGAASPFEACQACHAK